MAIRLGSQPTSTPFGANPPATSSSSFTFSPTTSTTTATQNAGLFGSSTSFGGSASTPTQPAPTFGGSFGSALPNTNFSSGMMSGELTAPDMLTPQHAGIERSFHELQAALAEVLRDGRVNPEARAMAMCYDMVSGGGNAMTRPDFVRPELWSAAVVENPDPEQCVPVLVVGFAALRRRVEVAREACASNESLVAEIGNAADLLSRAAAVSDAETADLRARNDRLVLRLLRVAKKLQVLRSAHIPVYHKERSLAHSLEALAVKIKRADAKLDELARKIKHSDHLAPTAIVQPTTQLQAALQAQTEGLQRLLEVTAKDDRDLILLKEALK